MKKFKDKLFFYLRFKVCATWIATLRTFYYSMIGMETGTGTILPKIFCTWPHKVSIGNHCILEPQTYFKYDGIWEKGASIIIGDHVFIGFGNEFNISVKITIGDHSMIASGCKFIDHNHGTSTSEYMNAQLAPKEEITIGKNVWIGCNSVVLKGVKIEDGAIVAAGSVVNRSIPSNEIWGGVPAKKIKSRTA